MGVEKARQRHIFVGYSDKSVLVSSPLLEQYDYTNIKNFAEDFVKE